MELLYYLIACFERQDNPKRLTKRDIQTRDCELVHFPSTHKSQSCARLNTGARSSSKSPMGMVGTQVLKPSNVACLSLDWQELDTGS